MEARTRLGYELTDKYAYPLIDGVLHLMSEEFNPEKEYFEFLIKGDITPEGIRLLLSLPYEVALTEANGEIVLTTGLMHSMGPEKDYEYRRDNSRVSFHTHPVVNREIPLIGPSFNDVYVSEFASDKTTLGLAHANGIMIYRKPIFNPDAKTYFENEEARDAILLYCKNRGIDILGGRKELREFWDLSDAEKVRLQRRFAEETKMIVDEASWEDQRGLERVLSKLFGIMD